jgi:hypothetical protein
MLCRGTVAVTLCVCVLSVVCQGRWEGREGHIVVVEQRRPADVSGSWSRGPVVFALVPTAPVGQPCSILYAAKTLSDAEFYARLNLSGQ